MIVIKTRVGKSVVEISADDAKIAIEQASFFQMIPELCPICQADIKFTYRKTKEKGYTYYGLECRGEHKHGVTFGQYQSGGGLFYKINDPWLPLAQRLQNAGGSDDDHQYPHQ